MINQKDLNAFEEIMGFRLADNVIEFKYFALSNQIDNLKWLINNTPKTKASNPLVQKWEDKLNITIKKRNKLFPNVKRIK